MFLIQRAIIVTLTMIIFSVTMAFAQIITMRCDINSGKRQHAKMITALYMIMKKQLAESMVENDGI